MRPSQKLFGLNVAENRLQDISSLFRFKGLMTLIASNNKLSSINADGIGDGSEMTSLNVDNTTISEIDFVGRLRRLRELYAANNRIGSFNVERLVGSDELAYISLRSNPLESINIAMVDIIFPKLRILDISNSPLEADCRELLELHNKANDKSLNLNINTAALSGCLRS